MKILIVSGGSIEKDFALDFLKKHTFEYVIAVDKGAEFCKDAGIRPDVLTGDFDTLAPEVLRFFKKTGVPVRKFRPEKDDTDMEIALGMAKEKLERRPEDHRVTILGGTGTRLDHMLGTLYCMAGIGPEVPCELVDAHNRVRVLWPGSYVLNREACFGPYVSLLPIGGDAKGITLTGFKYPLTEHTMTCYNSLGISNELVEEEACISFREGVLACFETRD